MLDEMMRFESGLSDVSHDVDAIKERVRDNEKSLVKAMNCQYLASLYGLEKLPAIVVDGAYVAYGADSVSRALEALKTKGGSHA